MTEIKTTEQEQKQEQKETNKELDYYRRITGLAQRASYGIKGEYAETFDKTIKELRNEGWLSINLNNGQAVNNVNKRNIEKWKKAKRKWYQFFKKKNPKEKNVPKIFHHSIFTGLDATAFINKAKKEIIVAYRGTEFKSPLDLFNDLLFAFGIQPFQTLSGGLFYHKLIKNDELSSYKFIFTGHSLGGAVAMKLGYDKDVDTYTFNSVGIPKIGLAISKAMKSLSKSTPDKQKAKIYNFFIENEPVRRLSKLPILTFIGEDYAVLNIFNKFTTKNHGDHDVLIYGPYVPLNYWRGLSEEEKKRERGRYFIEAKGIEALRSRIKEHDKTEYDKLKEEKIPEDNVLIELQKAFKVYDSLSLSEDLKNIMNCFEEVDRIIEHTNKLMHEFDKITHEEDDFEEQKQVQRSAPVVRNIDCGSGLEVYGTEGLKQLVEFCLDLADYYNNRPDEGYQR